MLIHNSYFTGTCTDNTLSHQYPQMSIPRDLVILNRVRFYKSTAGNLLLPAGLLISPLQLHESPDGFLQFNANCGI